MAAPSPSLRMGWALLGLMSAFSFGGPVAIGYALAGGPSRDWPPDRPVEWVVLVGVAGGVAVLMTLCLLLTLRSRPGKTKPPGASP